MIALDSNLFIYMLEGHPQFGGLARDIFVATEQTSLDACASELTFFEVLSYNGLSEKQVQKGRERLHEFGVRYLPLTTEVLLEAAKLRRQHSLGALDSLHVASALGAGCTDFVSNDQALLRKKVPGIKLVPLQDSGALLATGN